jgi:NAD(P)-dependent dehydrogenase (short-subunit alcohol dehydrogenase family)
VTHALAAEGAQVVAGARETSDDLSALTTHTQTQFVAADLSTPEGPAHVIDAAVTAFGGLDLLVNNVGVAHPRVTDFLSVTDEEWTNALAINFLTAVRTTRAALPHLLERKAGVIVTICSVDAFQPNPLAMDYSAAKAASLNFSKALSKEVGPKGVRVNTVSPGPVSTDLWLGKTGIAATIGQAIGRDPEAIAKQTLERTVTGRFTTPQEVADLVLFLASDRAGNVTGADFVIDGGLITTFWRRTWPNTPVSS